MTSTDAYTMQTSVDVQASAYKPIVGIVGTDVRLDPTSPDAPLTLNGENGHGLRLSTLDIVTSVVLWSPGNRDKATVYVVDIIVKGAPSLLSVSASWIEIL